MADWGRDWFTYSIPRVIHEQVQLLAATWQVSPENAISLLTRAVVLQVWPEGDILTDPAAYQEWALRVVSADPEQNPHLARPEERVSLAELGIDAAGIPIGLPLPGGRNPFESGR